MQTVIEMPDAKVIQEEHSQLIDEAKAVKVTSAITHGHALTIMQALTMRERVIDEKLGPIIESAHKTHKSLTTLRSDLKRPIEEAKSLVNLEVNGYEERERQERERIQREAEAAARKAEEDRKLQEAVRAEEEGDTEQALAILEERVETPVVHVEPKLAKVEGVSAARKTYSAEVVDLMALVKHVIAHPEDLALLSPNMPAINARARSQREGFKLAGCKLVAEKSRSFRAI